MEYVVQFARYMDKFRNIMMIVFKFLQREEVFNVIQTSSQKIVHSDHLEPLLNEPITQMGS